MKEPVGTRYVPGYDLFKLIVAVLLTVILIVLLLRESRKRFEQVNMLETPLATLALTSTAPLSITSTPVSPTPTFTEMPATTESVESPVPTEVIPTEAPAFEVTPSSTPESSASNECPSNPTRIQSGDTVRVLDWLNFRTGPGLNFPIQNTNRPGTEMSIIGGPICTIKEDDPPRAYLWWNVRMTDGLEGWSAEAPLNFPNYFLEPIR